MENKFKVGDRVKVVAVNSNLALGKKGVVIKIDPFKWSKYLVKWEDKSEDWWTPMKWLSLIASAKLKSTIGKALKNYGTTKAYRNEVITHLEDATFYQDDKLTFLKTVKGTGYAFRNPEDVNDAEKGIYLAVTRIFGETKPKWQVEVDECVKKGEPLEIMIKSENMQKEVEDYFISIGGSYCFEESKNSDKIGKFLALEDLEILLNANSYYREITVN